MIYPRNCIGCGCSSPEPFKHLCWDCYADTTRVEPPFCRQCGDPVAGNVQHDYICYACSRKAPCFEMARSAVRYEGGLGEALRALKYDAALWLVDDLVSVLAACVQAEYSEVELDWVVPVPLFPARRRSRGYNQSALLARALSKRLGLLYKERCVRRIRSTATQTGLTAPQRAANVSRAFRSGMLTRPAGKNILLVDDVMTTGATVDACAAALKEGGAVSVYVATVARG